jgi:hypothetical protein
VYEEQLLDLKIEKLEKLLKLDDLLIEAMEREDMDSIASLMEEKFMIISEIKAIDGKLKERRKEKDFSEQKEEKFRYIKRALNRLKDKEERLLYMAYERMEHIEKELEQINKALRINKKYKKLKERKSVFERVG